MNDASPRGELVSADEMARLLRLQEASWRALLRCDEGLERGDITHAELHAAWSSARACDAWLAGAGASVLERDVHDEDRRAIVNLFTSYIRTSYRFSWALVLPDGTPCACEICPPNDWRDMGDARPPGPADGDAGVSSSPERRGSRPAPGRSVGTGRDPETGKRGLVRPGPRQPPGVRLWPRDRSMRSGGESPGKAGAQADVLRGHWLDELARRLGVELEGARRSELLHSKDLKESLDVLTYAVELRRRAEGHVEGRAVARLWRRIMTKQRPILSVERVLAAQDAVACAIRDPGRLTGPSC